MQEIEAYLDMNQKDLDQKREEDKNKVEAEVGTYLHEIDKEK